MSDQKTTVRNITFEVIKANTENLNLQSITEETLLLSEGSSMDSMTIVSIIVDLESELSDFLGKEISLSDDKAMSRTISPYESVKNLLDYIFEITS